LSPDPCASWGKTLYTLCRDLGSSDGVPGCYQKEYSLVRLAKKIKKRKKPQAPSSKQQASSLTVSLG